MDLATGMGFRGVNGPLNEGDARTQRNRIGWINEGC